MSFEIRRVARAEFATEASEILSGAWAPPALHYSPEYVSWQLDFPGPCEAPAVAAFVGSLPVGFAAGVHRRVRVAGEAVDVLVVTFVAVLPDYRGQGIVHALYARLLADIRQSGLPVITFGRSNSSGQRAIEHAYPAADFPLKAFGEYAGYAIMPRSVSPGGWNVSTALPPIPLETPLAWSSPTELQFEHYSRDPRKRRLWMHPDGGWAWATEIEFVSQKGLETVTTLEAISGVPLDRLAGLAAAAGEGRLVQAPNLMGYNPQGLRPIGFRQVSTPWVGYWSGSAPANATNLEII